VQRTLPASYRAFIEGRHVLVHHDGPRLAISARGFWVGGFLSLLLAGGAPYVTMAMRATPLAFDFTTVGAICLFVILAGAGNGVLKLTARHPRAADWLAILVPGVIAGYYSLAGEANLDSPAFLINAFFASTAVLNACVVRRGASLALNRAELTLVYVMLLVVSSLCTMGMSQQLLPALSAFYYYASPENKWVERLLPHLPERVLVQGQGPAQAFFEGVGAEADVSYGAWVEPLVWWGVFLAALYVCMICIAVILRRQWVDRERLPYPLMQVGAMLISGDRHDRVRNGLLFHPSTWIGASLPLVAGGLRGLQAYMPAVPDPVLSWSLPILGGMRASVHFAMVGFSYLINTQVAASIWIFHLLAKAQAQIYNVTGLSKDQTFVYSVSQHPLLAYQGGGALIAMVLLGLWMGRGHLKQVWGKAIGRSPEVDDGDEILSYRTAVVGLATSMVVMVGWLWLMGTAVWVGCAFIVVALLIFIGLSRVIAEAGLAAVRAPMIAPDLITQGLGSQLVGATGTVNLSLAYVWSADIRIFLMAIVVNSLKLTEGMDLRSRRFLFGGIVLALFVGAIGSCWMVFHLVHDYGGINLDQWRFKSGPMTIFNQAIRALDQPGVYWPGWAAFSGGGVVMLLLSWARYRLPWWPLHPIGLPVSANMLMQFLWFSVFVAWAIKSLVLRFGGPSTYRKSQRFFLGLIMGEALINGLWVAIDFLTGRMGNVVLAVG
jgi:hypothetical protein